jgi:hypothetical protein
VKSSVFGGEGLPHEFQQRLHFLHTKPVLMFFNQHMQRRQRPRHRIHNHQLFHFGEFVVPDRVEERGDLLRCLQRDMRSLERKVILQLPSLPRVRLLGGYLELDCLEVAGLVFCAPSSADGVCGCADVCVDFVVCEEAFARLEDLLC